MQNKLHTTKTYSAPTKTRAPRRFKRLNTRNDWSLKNFWRDESGSLIIFSLFAFVLMVVLSGIAIDVMRHEITRIRLQNTLDRAILAAADLDQPLDPETVVRDYFAKANMSDYLGTVTVDGDEKNSYRTVTADATAVMPTMFLSWEGINIDELSAFARGRAEERITNVEISLVVDISGSMRGTKIATLRTAGQSFVDSVLHPASVDRVSMSLIPYTAQVNAGPHILGQMNLTPTPRHNFSHCVEFTEADFAIPGLVATPASAGGRDYYQGQHGYSYRALHSRGANDAPQTHGLANPSCPRQPYERIIPISQNRELLKDALSKLVNRHNTAIHTGMKWGTILLSPDTQPMIERLSEDSSATHDLDGTSLPFIETVFGNRPASWTTSGSPPPEGGYWTDKYIVLMTDGHNVGNDRLRRQFYNSPSEYAFWDRVGGQTWVYDYSTNRRYSDYHINAYTATDANNRLQQICDVAKANGITVFSIGVEVTESQAGPMRNCATPGGGHFFKVNNQDLAAAFDTIANQINKLRLTQ